MSDSLPGLVVLAIGGSVAPPLLLLTILSLASHRPLPNATALALGYLTTGLAIGAMVLILFSRVGDIISVVEHVFSLTACGLGLRSLLHVPDPGAPPPGWMETIRFMSPAKAFAFAAFFPLIGLRGQ